MAGERALFARPEFHHDLISYDLITPVAARGLLDALHWRPGLQWVVEAIRLLRPIRRECLEQDGRRMLILRDVAYLIDAHFELSPDQPAGMSGKHSAMFKRAVRSGVAPYLGRDGFTADVALVDADHEEHASGRDSLSRVDHGWLLHSIAFEADRKPRFFRAESVGGLVRVPSVGSPLLFG